jgi:acyl carrier protein
VAEPGDCGCGKVGIKGGISSVSGVGENESGAKIVSIESDLTEFISRDVVPEGGVTETEQLISSGKVDSLGLLQILGYIEQTYGVTLLTSGSPKDFESVQNLAGAIRKARGESA